MSLTSVVETQLWKTGVAIDPRVQSLLSIRQDRFIWLIAVAIAVVLVLGVMTAWFVYCQSNGGWPAVDMPNFQSGGTWKFYCAK
jgi:hypothetical protein